MLYDIRPEQVRLLNEELGVRVEAAISGIALIHGPGHGGHAWVTFNAMRRQPDGFKHPAGTGIFSIECCVAAAAGYPNEDVRKWGDTGDIYEVLDSPWIAAIEKNNRECFPDVPYTEGARHIAIAGHDESCQFIALKPYGSLAKAVEFHCDPRPYEEILADIIPQFLQG
ncbi:MAG: hypothetical protein ACF8R7_15060 [Phycisphaerales bacterium JB039]